MFTQQNAIDITTSFLKKIDTDNLHIRKVILFGSFAKNTANEFSDIDVAIIADEFIGSTLMDRNFYKNIIIQKPFYIIQPKTYNTSYFENGDPFIDEIKKTGIEIPLN